MRIDILRQPLPLTLLITALLLGLAMFRFSMLPDAAEVVAAGVVPLGALVDRLQSEFPSACRIVSALIFLVNGILISRFVSRHMVFAVRTYLPAVFYAVVAAGIYFTGADLNIALVSWLLVKAGEYFVLAFRRTESFGAVFTASLLLGFAPLFYAGAAVYLLLIPVALRVYRRKGREMLVALFGACLPALVAAYAEWACGGAFPDVFIRIWTALTAYTPFIMEWGPQAVMRIAVVSMFVLLLFLSAGTFFSQASDMRVRAMKIYIFNIWFLIIALLSLLLPSSTPFSLAFAAVPAAVMLPAFFSRYTGIVPALLYILLLILTTTLNLLPLAPV